MNMKIENCMSWQSCFSSSVNEVANEAIFLDLKNTVKMNIMCHQALEEAPFFA